MKNVLRWLLVSLPILVAVAQLCFSNFSNLTRWKGGGFGMYTDIHINHRSIWLKIELEDTTKYVKIQPVEKPWAPDDKQVAAIRKELSQQLDKLVSFPAAVDFEDPAFARVKALANEPAAKKFSILIGHLALDIDKETIQNKVLYSHDI